MSDILCSLRRLDGDLARIRQPEVFRPKEGRWDAEALFQGLHRDDLALTDSELVELKDFFWTDLYAEYDAKNLHEHIHRRGDEGSPEFLEFEAAWYRDEMNHYRGFRALYSILYGESSREIEERLEAREVDFTSLETFFGDEFRLAVLFAYDELATTRAYFADYPLYERFEHPVLKTFIQTLVRDESFHYQNAVALIRRNHSSRLDEVGQHIEDFVNYDMGEHKYRATFLFDHEWTHVERTFFRETGEILKSRLEP